MLKAFLKSSLLLLFILCSAVLLANIADGKLAKDFKKQQGREIRFMGNQTGTAKIPLWERETIFYSYNRFKSFGIGPESSENDSSGRPTLLVIGDSYTWGYGMSEPSLSWPNQFRKLLKVDGYDVHTLSASGASFFEESEWVTKERIAKIKPDIIIFAFMVNDLMPSGRESILCDGPCQGDSLPNKEYISCISGDKSFFSIFTKFKDAFPNLAKQITLKYCARHLTDQSIPNYKYIPDFKEDPRTSYMEPALNELFKVVGDTKVFMVPYAIGEDQWDDVRSIVKDTAAITAPFSAFVEAHKEPPTKPLHPRWCITETDCHPGGLRNKLFAESLYKYLKSELTPSKRVGNDAFSANLVSHTMPHSIVKREGNVIKIDYQNEGIAAEFRGVRHPLQVNPCALLNTPYNHISIDSDLMSKGASIEIANGAKYNFYLLDYDFEYNQKVTLIASNTAKINLSESDSYKAVLYAPSESPKGCNLNEVIETDNSEVLITLVS